jgi:glycogen debranching enzyme
MHLTPTSDSSTIVTKTMNRALRIAIGDLTGNIHPFQDGLLDKPAPVLLAGLDYDTPWTRDAALNTWYGLGLLAPEVARNTLMSVLLREDNGQVRIGGQYWDAIVWAQGVWRYYLYTGDRSILEIAHEAVKNSLVFFEATELDAKDGLFRGGACFQDGVAGYPDYFAPTTKPYGGIMGWMELSGKEPVKTGVGLPCKALSTNCLYYRAYVVAGLLARELGVAPDPAWAPKAEALKARINERYWSRELGTYRYLVDAPENDDHQEGYGLAFALLFGIADEAQARSIFEKVYISPNGIPCVWPTYKRYNKPGHFGRHAGTVWPQVNAAWAMACHARGRNDLAIKELTLLAAKAERDSEFIEVFHPETGAPYGGLQEKDDALEMGVFGVCHRQSWCASGFLAMVLFCYYGLEVTDAKPLTDADRAEIWTKIPKLSFG